MATRGHVAVRAVAARVVVGLGVAVWVAVGVAAGLSVAVAMAAAKTVTVAVGMGVAAGGAAQRATAEAATGQRARSNDGRHTRACHHHTPTVSPIPGGSTRRVGRKSRGTVPRCRHSC